MPVWAFSIFGYWCFLSSDRPFDIKLLWQQKHAISFLGIFIFSLSVGSVYVLNQVADYKVDTKNNGFSLLDRGAIGKWTALIYALILFCLSTGVSLLIDKKGIAVFSVVTVVIGIAYCFKPFCFSGRPVMDFLTNAIGFGVIAFGAGWYIAGGKEIFGLFFASSALPYFFLMCGGSISSTLPDFSSDKACRKNTTAVVFGISNAHRLSILFVIIGGVAAFILEDWIAFSLAMCTLAVYIIYEIIKSQMMMEATYKVSGAFAMLIAGVLYPLFFPFAVIVFICTYIYFRFRHRVSYPSLVPLYNVSDEL